MKKAPVKAPKSEANNYATIAIGLRSSERRVSQYSTHECVNHSAKLSPPPSNSTRTSFAEPQERR